MIQSLNDLVNARSSKVKDKSIVSKIDINNDKMVALMNLFHTDIHIRIINIEMLTVINPYIYIHSN